MSLLGRLITSVQEAETARKKRNLTGSWEVVFKILAMTYSLFLIYTAVSGRFSSSTIRGFFIFSITVMIFLRYPATKRSPTNRPTVIDLVLILLCIPTFGNFCINYDQMAWRAGQPVFADVFFGIIAVTLVIEACRRAMSVILPCLAALSLGYGLFGPYFPAILKHQGFTLNILIQDTYASMNGIFGLVAYIFSAYVVLFVIMGAFFQRIGADAFLIDLPLALTGRFRGGAAKSCVTASMFFGMISGSATANTVTTGAFTIPMMKRVGYRPEVAGAIEPAASTVGMFMPPIMGAGAFIMAEMLAIPYISVVKYALIPALLYFFSVLILVHFESIKTGIGQLPKEDRLDTWPVFKAGWYYALPIVVLLYVLLSGRTPSLAAFYAIISAAVIAVIKSLFQKNLLEGLRLILLGLVEGGEKSLIIGTTAGPIGIIIGVALLTGLAFKFSVLVLSFTYGLKWMALVLVFIATFVLGMGMSVTADYMILAILAVPAMGEMGIPLIAGHFTAFWYSQSSNVTPPVCIAAFAGASIAGGNPYQTGFQAMKFSAYLYFMPFLFVYTPILMPDGFNSHVLFTWCTAFISTIPFAASITGYFFGDLKFFQRILLFVASFLLLFPGIYTDGGGLLLTILTVLPNYLRNRSGGIQRHSQDEGVAIGN